MVYFDSELKRSSVLNFGTPFPVTIPTPDGTMGTADGAHLSDTYAYGSAGPTPAGAGVQNRLMRVGVGVGIGV